MEKFLLLHLPKDLKPIVVSSRYIVTVAPIADEISGAYVTIRQGAKVGIAFIAAETVKEIYDMLKEIKEND